MADCYCACHTDYEGVLSLPESHHCCDGAFVLSLLRAYKLEATLDKATPSAEV
jgi:hypothetical protein